jgi:hypothetical protein
VDASVRAQGQSGAAREIDILNAFAGQVHRRVKHTVSEIDDNQDELIKELANDAFEHEKYSWDTL